MANALTPDELTLGRGQGTHEGGIQTHSPEWDYSGESESTYAALTWNLPTWDSGETSEDRRRIREESVVLEMAAEEETAASRLKEVSLPPMWLIAAVVGILVFLVLAAMKKSRRKTWR